MGILSPHPQLNEPQHTVGQKIHGIGKRTSAGTALAMQAQIHVHAATGQHRA
jgi:hypothetical protein